MDYSKTNLYSMVNAIEEARYAVTDPKLKGRLGDISDLLDSLIVDGVVEREVEEYA
jgi:predicted double-glycine peptidase